MLGAALLLSQGARGLPIDWVALGLGSVQLFLLVVARMAELVAQVQDQATQLEALAHNDALTGIPNRRAWDLDLVRESSEQPVQAADVARYQAKDNGRNRVVALPSQLPEGSPAR